MPLRILTLTVLVLALPVALHAQNGCVNSPENPTALLALTGVAAGAWSTFGARRKN